MKKIISSFLAILITLSALIPTAAYLVSAEDTAAPTTQWETVGITDFDSGAQYDLVKATSGAYKIVPSEDAAKGYSAYFWRAAGKGEKWPMVCPLVNTEGTEIISLRTADKAKVTFDIYVDYATAEEGYATNRISDTEATFYVSLIFVDPSKASAIQNNSSECYNQLNEGRNVILAETTAATLGEKQWNTLEATFDVPTFNAGYKPFLIVYAETSNYFELTSTKNAGIFIDNIKVEQQALTREETHNSTIDFDSNSQADFYSTTPTDYFRNISGDYADIKNLEDGHNNVWYIERIHSTGNWSSYHCSTPAAITLSNTKGTSALYYETGEAFNISLEVKIAGTAPQDTSKDLFAGIVFDDEPTTKVGQVGNNCGVYKYNNNERLYALGRVDKTTTDWQTITGTVSVPEIGNGQVAKLVFYTKSQNGWYTEPIYVDNIVVSEYVEQDELTVDFDSNSQPKFYSALRDYNADAAANLYARLNAGANIVNVDEEHNNAALINTTVNSEGTSTAAQGAGSVALCDTTGTNKILLKPGTTANISFDIKAETSYDTFSVGLVFDVPYDSNSTYLGGKTNGLYDANTAGELTFITEVAQSNEWTTYSATVTVPEHDETGYAWLVVYQPGCEKTQEHAIYIDNITLKTVESTLVNFDSKSNSEVYSALSVLTYTTYGHTALLDTLSATNPVGLALAVEDSALNINFATGTALNVTADVKLAKCDDSEVYAGIVFADASSQIDLTAVTPIELGKLNSQNSDWQTVSGEITVPEHSAGKYNGVAAAEVPMLVVYTKSETEDLTAQEIYVDNIALSEGELPAMPLFGDVIGEGAVNVIDLIRMKKIATGGEYDTDAADLDYDGSVIAGDLSILKKILLNESK